MEIDWSGLIAVVTGALIAAGAGSVQARASRRAQREQAAIDRADRVAQFEAEQKARRDEEVRVRADAKADEVIAELDELRRILTRTIQLDGRLMPRAPEK